MDLVHVVRHKVLVEGRTQRSVARELGLARVTVRKYVDQAAPARKPEAMPRPRPVWDAVVEATEHRMRPIMLTAAAASLALIPIAREIFWGPMAYAMMGGIIVGTMLTLLFLPALYVAWFRIKEPVPATDNTHENLIAPEMPASLSDDAPAQGEMEHA